MKVFFKRLILRILKFNKIRRAIEIALKEIPKTQTISHKEVSLQLTTENFIAKYRAETFASKEPMTLSWIETFKKDSIFWDIGANVGIYSIYASKSKKIRTVAFEPSVFNLEILVRNIILNSLEDQIIVIPLSLNNSKTVSQFMLSSRENGAALSSFAHQIDQHGDKLNFKDKYLTIGSDIDSLITDYRLKQPDYIKIDVDGIEYFILQGGVNTLSKVKEILVEVSHSSKFTNKISEFFTRLGFILDRSENLSDNQSNQIWVKKRQ